jgi:hypothetical protein
MWACRFIRLESVIHGRASVFCAAEEAKKNSPLRLHNVKT